MRILVVEDEKDLNNVICKILKKENYIVDAVFDGEEAISYIDVYSYEVILLDIMIPKLNGYKVLEHVKKTNINTKVIFITAKDSLEDKILGLDMGAEDYLVKPFEFGELLARIRDFLAGIVTSYFRSFFAIAQANPLKEILQLYS